MKNSRGCKLKFIIQWFPYLIMYILLFDIFYFNIASKVREAISTTTINTPFCWSDDGENTGFF